MIPTKSMEPQIIEHPRRCKCPRGLQEGGNGLTVLGRRPRKAPREHSGRSRTSKSVHCWALYWVFIGCSVINEEDTVCT